MQQCCALTGLLISTLAASVFAFPSQLWKDDNTPRQTIEGNQTITGQTPIQAVTTSVPFSDRNVDFEFTRFGKQIPRKEVQNLLRGAESVISDVVDEHPLDPITNDRFEYHPPNGRTLIAIKTLYGKSITWAQLFRVLQALYRFMANLGPQQNHCFVLDFNFGIDGEADVGLGVVWFFHPGAHQSIKKDKVQHISRSRETLLTLPNVTKSSLSANFGGDDITWSIPASTLSLDFYFFGLPIPQEDLILIIHLAAESIEQYLDTSKEDSGIDNGTFHWQFPQSRDGSKAGISIFSYPNMDITWEQLHDIFRGLYLFATTLEQKHCQVLGFKIRDRQEGLLGVGSLWQYPRRTFQLKSRAERLLQTSLQISNFSFPSLAADDAGLPVIWSVPNSSIRLEFNYMGRRIPALELQTLLLQAKNFIVDDLIEEPDRSILDDRFSLRSEDGDIVVNILSDDPYQISWRTLDHVLTGLMSFCTGDHNQVLVFDIEISGKKAGFGTLLYRGNFATLAKRDLNMTAPASTPGLGAPPVHFPIPGTPDSLFFTSLGEAIPEDKARAALSGALNVIAAFVHSIPFKRVPKNRYTYNDEQGVSIVISISATSEVSWQELDEILAGLAMFMTGINPLPGQDGRTHNQALVFNIYLRAQGYIGNGAVTYNPQSQVTTSKRALVQIAANSSSHGSSVQPLVFPIIQSPLTLIFADFGINRIPRARTEELFDSVFRYVNASIQSHPNGTITNPWYHELDYPRRKGDISLVIHTQPGKSLSWQRLDQLLRGLDVFMVSQSATLTFVIDDASQGRIGSGAVLYKPPIIAVSKRTLAEIVPATLPASQIQLKNDSQNPPLNLTTMIPYHIPNTSITLKIAFRLDPIPQIYVSATLTSAIRVILKHEVLDDLLPQNTFHYGLQTTGVQLVYVAYTRDPARSLVYGELVEVLVWLESFITQSEDHCRQMTVEIDIVHAGESSATRIGSLTMVFHDPYRQFDAVGEQ